MTSPDGAQTLLCALGASVLAGGAAALITALPFVPFVVSSGRSSRRLGSPCGGGPALAALAFALLAVWLAVPAGFIGAAVAFVGQLAGADLWTACIAGTLVGPASAGWRWFRVHHPSARFRAKCEAEWEASRKRREALNAEVRRRRSEAPGRPERRRAPKPPPRDPS